MKYEIEIEITCDHKCECEYCDARDTWQGKIIVEADSVAEASEITEQCTDPYELTLADPDDEMVGDDGCCLTEGFRISELRIVSLKSFDGEITRPQTPLEEHIL